MGPLGAIGLTLLGIDVLSRFFPAKTLGRLPGGGGPRLRGVPPAGRGRKVHAPGIRQRLSIIRSAVKRGGADARVRELALGILTRKCGESWCVAEKDWKAEATALFDYVRENVRYTRDPLRHDTYVSASRTLGAWRGGDCDDLTIALGALLESVGFQTMMRVVQTEGNNGFNHIYLAAVLPEGGGALGGGRPETFALDASMDKPAGWEVPESMVIKRMDVNV